MSKINPCAKCGCEGKLGSEEPYFAPNQFHYYVYHSHSSKYDCSFHRDSATTPFFDNEEDAIDFWNRSYGFTKDLGVEKEIVEFVE